MIMIFSTSEPAQYVVVWPGSCEVKDISYIATIAIPSNLQITGLFQEKAQFCYLLLKPTYQPAEIREIPKIYHLVNRVISGRGSP
jgi:hypothetical protein